MEIEIAVSRNKKDRTGLQRPMGVEFAFVSTC